MTCLRFDGETEFSRFSILLDLCLCCKNEAQENPGASLNGEFKQYENPCSNTGKLN